MYPQSQKYHIFTPPGHRHFFAFKFNQFACSPDLGQMMGTILAE